MKIENMRNCLQQLNYHSDEFRVLSSEAQQSLNSVIAEFQVAIAEAPGRKKKVTKKVAKKK